MIWKDVINFGIGMVLGILAVFFLKSSYLLYYTVFCPMALILFIIINLNTQNQNKENEVSKE